MNSHHPDRFFNCPQGSRLQIGSGGKDIAGYVNTDARLQSSPSGIVFDLQTDPLPENRFSSIYLCHIWEHVFEDQAPALLHKMKQALLPRGILRISVPDLRKVVRGCVETLPGHPEHFGVYFNAPLFGPFLSTSNIWDVHKRGFTLESLSAELAAAGFRRIEPWRSEQVPEIAAVRDWSSYETISLNLQAIKP